jgi:hypothetical protein
MFRTVHADNKAALAELRGGELDAQYEANRLASIPVADPNGAIASRIRTEYAVAAQNAAGAMNNPAYRVDQAPHGWGSTATPTPATCAHCQSPATSERANQSGEWIKLCDSHMCLRKQWAEDSILPADHTIPMVEADARQASYGITHQSAFVYRTSKSSAPTRIVVWSNTGRLNARNGQPVRYGDYGPIDGGDGKFIDPKGKATDAPVSILLSPECTVIDAYGTGTGTVGSGQMWAPRTGGGQITLRPGETVSLAYPDGTVSGPYPVRFTNNGHGFIEII